jgi:hypothetical protein
MKYLLLFVLMLSISDSGIANDRLKQRIQKLFPGCEIKEANTRDHFESCYEIKIDQLLDHKNPQAGTFKQRFFLFHADNKAPVHLETEGYWANAYTREPAKILKANQVTVEYRFYGESKPDVIPWKYLTNDQAIEDLHRIVVTLKNIYSGPWISSGISKGGETTIIYKHHYPNDCDVHIPYVAPIILDREDPRTEKHLKTTGSDSCRQALHEFQRRCLERRDSMLVYLNDWAEKDTHSYTLATPIEALEYGVLEFTFSFWQWGGKCNEIPSSTASTREHFKYVNDLVGFDFYSDATFERLYPSYYQHELELGYYGFPTGHLDDLLTAVKDPDNMFFAPRDEKIVYNTEYMQPILEYVEGHGDHMIYVYGEYDTWYACSVHPSPLVDHLKMVLPGGSHSTRIANFPADQQQLIYDKLKEWLDVPVYPLEPKK